MNREDVEFMSDGIKLRWHFCTPESREGPYPTIVMAGGWCYVKELIQPEYAKYFVDAGFACLTFDYRIGVWGISYAGGHVFPIGALDLRPKILISVVPMLNGWYNSLRANSNVSMRDLWKLIEKDRVERFKTGKHGKILHSAHPHDDVSTFPAPETWPVFKKFKESVAPNHEHWTTVQSVEHVLAYDATPYMKRIIHQPTLLVTSA